MASELRRALLDLHAAIVAIEREDYERMAGTVSGAEFLRLLVDDPAWEWLRPLSALITELDDGAARAAARALLKPDPAGTEFQQRYAWLIERSPDVAYAHGAAMRFLKP